MTDKPGWCDRCQVTHPVQNMVDRCKTKGDTK